MVRGKPKTRKRVGKKHITNKKITIKMNKIFVVKDGPEKGQAVWSMKTVQTGSLYPNLTVDAESDRFYASNSFSHLWTEKSRPFWSREEVEEITPNVEVLAIANHGDSEDVLFFRHFQEVDSATFLWLRENLRHSSNRNLGGRRVENPFLMGWFGAWEWTRKDGVSVQMRDAPEGYYSDLTIVRPFGERHLEYAQQQRESTARAIAQMQTDHAFIAWQKSMVRV